MARENYARCLANTLREEGGWTDDPRDPGGPTNFGIIQREYDKYRDARRLPRRSVRFIEAGEYQAIYRGNYWEPMRGDLWPKGPDQIVFDIAVNSGTGAAPRMMGFALGTPERTPRVLAMLAASSDDQVGIVKRACARRASFYRSLRTFSAFGRGWLARNARMEAIGVKMVLEAQGHAAPAVVLEAEQARARTAAKTNAAGAAGAGAVETTHVGGAAVAEPSAWDWTSAVGTGVVLLILLVLTAALAWAWLHHRERVKAYAAAIAGELEATLGPVAVAAGAASARLEEVI